VERRNESTPLSLEHEWPGSIAGTETILNSDSRWTLVSSSISALVVGSIAWLALGTMPNMTSTSVENASRGFLPYRLFQELTQSGSSAMFASMGSIPGSQARPGSTLDDALAAERANPKPQIETHTVTLEQGNTLAGALENAGISKDDANAALTALTKVYSPRSLRAGLTFELTYNASPNVASTSLNDSSSDDDDNGDLSRAQAVQGEPIARLISIKFSPAVDHEIAVARTADGSFGATDTVKQLVPHIHRAGATIDGSLYLSAMKAGIPTDVVGEMIKMFSYKVDFQRDLHPGDSFEVFYDYYYTPEGQPAKEGNISYAVMRLGGKDIALYRYQSDPNSPAEYFDSKGESAKGMLMKTPVDGARITSGFGMRFHPVLGYSRMHKGIDFGVPIGTPVMSAGAGTVAFMGWESGYGRFVLVNNGNGYSTAYGHLSRFAPGLHRGSHVGQAQVIAYSGNTGMTTGPHLHYEIRINSQQVDPRKVKMAQGRKLAGHDLRTFQAERLKIDDKIASTTLETKVADIATNLRTTR
jgi:murein DD-endopeptidase MepM/ murein hydrolase activator NlpD